MFNNDLVGVNKPWGNINNLEKWKLSLYYRYRNMVYRCESPNSKQYCNYGAKGIKCEFVSLSQYYNALKSQKKEIVNNVQFYTLDDFIKNPDLYEIDKDIRLGHGSNYAPNTIAIVSIKDNHNEMFNRNGVPDKFMEASHTKKAWEKTSKTEGKLVIGVSPCGDVEEWHSARYAAKQLGVHYSVVNSTCNGGERRHNIWHPKPHLIQKGKLSGWSFFWKQDYYK